jgi:hypothetical protein
MAGLRHSVRWNQPRPQVLWFAAPVHCLRRATNPRVWVGAWGWGCTETTGAGNTLCWNHTYSTCVFGSLNLEMIIWWKRRSTESKQFIFPKDKLSISVFPYSLIRCAKSPHKRIGEAFATKKEMAVHARRAHNCKYVFSSFLNSIMAVGLNVVSSGAYIGSVHEGDQSLYSQCQSGKYILFLCFTHCYLVLTCSTRLYFLNFCINNLICVFKGIFIDILGNEMLSNWTLSLCILHLIINLICTGTDYYLLILKVLSCLFLVDLAATQETLVHLWEKVKLLSREVAIR